VKSVVTAILKSVVLYECETWPLSLWKKYRLRIFENRFLRRIFASTGDEIIGGWKKLHNEEFQNSYYSKNIITMIKSRGMNVAPMGTREMHARFSWENHKVRCHWEDLDLCGRMIL
jgi:hypothetical protein